MMSATMSTAQGDGNGNGNGKHRPAHLLSGSTATTVANPTSPQHAAQQPLSAASTGSIDFFSSSSASVCSDDLGIVSMSEADGSSSDGDGPRSSSALSATSWSDLDSPTSQSPGVLTSEPNSPVKLVGSVSKAVAMRLSPLPSPAIVASAAATQQLGNTEQASDKTPRHMAPANVSEQEPSTLAWGLAKVVNLVTLSLLDPAIDPWVSDAPFNGDHVGYHSPRAPAAKPGLPTKTRNTNNLSLPSPQIHDDQQQEHHVPTLSLATTLNGSHSPTDLPSPLDLIDEDSPYLSSPSSDDTQADGPGFFKALLSPISSRFRSWLTDTTDDDDTHDDMTTPAYEGSDPFAFSDIGSRHHHHRSDSYTLFDSSPLASPVASSSDAMDTLGMRLFSLPGAGRLSEDGDRANEADGDGVYLRRWTPSPTVF